MTRQTRSCPYRPRVIAHKIKKPGLNATYPVVRITNSRLSRFVNREIKALFNQLLRKQGYGKDPKTEITAVYHTRLNSRCLLSLSLEVYAYTPPAAHGLTLLKSLNFDLAPGKQLHLKDLFLPGCNYVQRINQEIRHQIRSRDVPLLKPFVAISKNPDFYLTPENLVIYFQVYEYTPYVYGFPQFPIPYLVLAPCIGPKSPLQRLL
ncbi:MAG: RsiV family protein [Heliobacteriaceae bacterium]|nr:RsiV family protein [Heliobacteriaceae bacterium]MDD4587732.1 RsiV family protein [Heliobacteriaceae bacterium]